MKVSLMTILDAVGIGKPRIHRGGQMPNAGAVIPDDPETFLFLTRSGERKGIPLPHDISLPAPESEVPDKLQRCIERDAKNAMQVLAREGFVPVISFPILQPPGTPWDDLHFNLDFARTHDVSSLFTLTQSGLVKRAAPQYTHALKTYSKLMREGFRPSAFLHQTSPNILTALGLSIFFNSQN